MKWIILKNSTKETEPLPAKAGRFGMLLKPTHGS